MVGVPLSSSYYPIMLSEHERDLLLGLLPPPSLLVSQETEGVIGDTGSALGPSVLGHLLGAESGSTPSPAPSSSGGAYTSAGGLVDTTSAFLGLDARTTVMLKRIPRKMTSGELVDILTQVHGLENSFDFLHIPWDSARNTSRGFAFVHFSSALHVGILSDAVQSGALPVELRNCELRYARIQGDAASLSQLIKSDSHS